MSKSEKNRAYEILSKRLLELEKKIEVIRNKLKMARLDGDYKENADQQILEKENDWLQEQINLLKVKKISTKEVVDKIITYRLLETGEEKTVELTNWREPDHSRGYVSFASPLGLALTNKKIGEVSEVNAEKKSYKIRIISIK
jgi:transcription elongation factor GreA